MGQPSICEHQIVCDPRPLRLRSWTFKCGSGVYVRLMDEFPKVTAALAGLDAPFQEVPLRIGAACMRCLCSERRCRKRFVGQLGANAAAMRQLVVICVLRQATGALRCLVQCCSSEPRVVKVQFVPQVITDITRRMGEGMAEFISKEVVSVADYDRCWAQVPLDWHQNSVL